MYDRRQAGEAIRGTTLAREGTTERIAHPGAREAESVGTRKSAPVHVALTGLN
jgi:hypothetical protein